jgi:hypothetical protein
MSTAQYLPIVGYCETANPTTAPIFTVSLDTFNLNMKYTNLGDIAGSMLRQTLYDQKYFIKTQTYIGANATIATGSSGNVSIPLQIRNSSLKSLFYQFSLTADARCVNGLFDAINPNLISLQVSIGGQKYPQRPLRPVIEPAETYNSYIQALGANSLKGVGGVMDRSSYNATQNTTTGSDPSVVVPASGARAKSSYEATNLAIAEFPNMNYQGVDLERISGTLFSGINTRQTGVFLECNIGTALTAVNTCYAFGLLDAIIVVDIANKTIEVLT